MDEPGGHDPAVGRDGHIERSATPAASPNGERTMPAFAEAGIEASVRPVAGEHEAHRRTGSPPLRPPRSRHRAGGPPHAGTRSCRSLCRPSRPPRRMGRARRSAGSGTRRSTSWRSRRSARRPRRSVRRAARPRPRRLSGGSCCPTSGPRACAASRRSRRSCRGHPGTPAAAGTKAAQPSRAQMMAVARLTLDRAPQAQPHRHGPCALRGRRSLGDNDGSAASSQDLRRHRAGDLDLARAGDLNLDRHALPRGPRPSP